VGSFSLWHWLVVIILVLLLFGRGRISDLMGDLGKGLKSFKQGMADEEPRQIERDRPADVTPEARRQSDPVPPAGEPPRS
jgi:sec-independent protein translocase protein TatA